MCILCVIQKWSRRVATMLPWLVIPMIGLWVLSQLLPPAFRFEITSPRLACVFVLLVTLFWYEILMPQLSAWRVRRNARLRERKRFKAIEMQKLRKTATRRCRNCLTPYKDQNPSCGKFMCSYCGHVSRRPVLDLPVPPGLGFSNSGMLKDLVGKSGKMLNGKVWSDNGWTCGQDWLENSNWVSGSFSEKSSYWQENGVRFFCGDGDCLEESSYSRVVVIFACKILKALYMSIRWVWRKMTRVSSARDDSLSDAEHKGMLGKEDENGANLQESKGEKARRKAEEKRQARLEREQLEEEERKQREEVARLVEERRKLRGDKVVAEKDHSRVSTAAREKDIKKEAERKRQERRKEKDKGSSKSNSDAEELEKRAGKESERKWEFDRKSETDRWESQSGKAHGTEMAHGSKVASANNHSLGNTGTRYLDRVRGTFFGKVVNTTAVISREYKPNGSVDHVHSSTNGRESFQSGKNMNADDKTVSRPVISEPQPSSAPKKSWHQLFSRSSAVPQPTNSNVISRPNGKSQAQVQSPPLAGHSFPAQSYANPIDFGLPSPFTLPTFPGVSTSSGFVPPLSPEAKFPRFGEARSDFLPDESEIFGDPCYIPDPPVSLLGPVSESLNNFQLNLGTGFATDVGLQKPSALKNISASAEYSRPSPIESPLSRIRAFDERNSFSNQYPSTTKAQNLYPSPINGLSNANEQGTWQMWSTSPLGQDSLGLVGGPASWLLHPEMNRSNKGELVHPMPHKPMASPFRKDYHALSSTHSPQKVSLGNCQNGVMFSASVPGATTDGPWLPQTLGGSVPGMEGHFSHYPPEEASQNDMIYGSTRAFATNHQAGLSPANWAKKEWAMQGSGESNRSMPVTRAHIGGLHSTSDAQSFWSYD